MPAQPCRSATLRFNRRLAALTALYRYLMLMDADAPDCPVIARRHYLRRGRQLPRDVEDATLEQLFAVIDSSRDRAMFLLMLRCGLRVGEVQTLTLDDLFLNPTAGQLPRLWLHGKGGYERVAYLSAQTLTAVRAWLRERPQTTAAALFLNRFNQPLTVTGIQWRLRVHCRKAGIWLTCHQLRHTFARHLIEAGVPITTIQRLLGHSRIRLTETYLHISDQQVQRDYQAAIATLTDRWLRGDDGLKD